MVLPIDGITFEINQNIMKVGNTLRCKVTGFTGIATARVEYLNGCVQFGLTPRVQVGDKFPETTYVDHQQLEVVDNGLAVDAKGTGGVRNDSPNGIGLAK